MPRLTTEEWKKRQSKSLKQTDWVQISQQLIPLILALGGLSFFFAGLGYIVFNLTIGYWTDIQLYDVSSSQYIPVGVLTFLFVSAIILPPFIGRYFLAKVRPTEPDYRWNAVFFVVIILLSLFEPIWLISIYQGLDSTSANSTSEIAEIIAGIFLFILYFFAHLTFPETINYELVFQFFFLTILAMIFILVTHSSIPHSIGGGRPSTVQILFVDTDVSMELGIPLSDDPQLSTTICILAKLNNDLLVYVPSNVQNQQYTITIPNEAILSIRDTQEYISCRSPRFANRNLPTATPQATPTP